MAIPNTHPSPLAGVPPSVLGSLGERLGAIAHELQQGDAGLAASARERVAELARLGMELQLLVHAMGAAGGRAVEDVPVLDAAQAARRQWLAELRRRGATLQVQGSPVTVALEPALVQHVLDLAIAHGLAAGGDLQLRVMADETSRRAAIVELQGQGPGPGAAEVHGQLLQWLARAEGWRWERPAPEAGRWVLRLRLGEPDSDLSEEGLPRMHWQPGARVLVIEPDDRYRIQASELLRRAGFTADGLKSLAEVPAALHDGDPFAVVSGLALADPQARAVFEPLRSRVPTMRWIELVDAPHVFAAGSPDGQIAARISRGDLAHTLLPSLAQ